MKYIILHIFRFFLSTWKKIGRREIGMKKNSQPISTKEVTMILVEVTGKITQRKFKHVDSEIFHFLWFNTANLSQFFSPGTSSSLTPYYSKRAQEYTLRVILLTGRAQKKRGPARGLGTHAAKFEQKTFQSTKIHSFFHFFGKT